MGHKSMLGLLNSRFMCFARIQTLSLMGQEHPSCHRCCEFTMHHVAQQKALARDCLFILTFTSICTVRTQSGQCKIKASMSILPFFLFCRLHSHATWMKPLCDADCRELTINANSADALVLWATTSQMKQALSWITKHLISCSSQNANLCITHENN